jgi:hypothetical protein
VKDSRTKLFSPGFLSTDPSYTATHFTWSPDGKYLVFKYGSEWYCGDIWILEVENPNNAAQLIKGTPCPGLSPAMPMQTPSWSPRGNLLAFMYDGEIRVVDLAPVLDQLQTGQQVIPIPIDRSSRLIARLFSERSLADRVPDTNVLWNAHPAWSHNGQFLAYLSSHMPDTYVFARSLDNPNVPVGADRIYVMPIDMECLTERVQNGEADITTPKQCSTGKWSHGQSEQLSTTVLTFEYWKRLKGFQSFREKYGDNAYLVESHQLPSWSPDDQWIAFTIDLRLPIVPAITQADNIVISPNWFAAIVPLDRSEFFSTKLILPDNRNMVMEPNWQPATPD